MKALIPGYPEGSNISLLNLNYIPPQPSYKNGRKVWSKDKAQFIFYNFNDNKIHTAEIENVPYEFFVLKDDISVEHPQFFVSRNDVNEVECNYRDLNKEIAKRTNQTDFLKQIMRDGTYKQNVRQLHLNERVLGSDMHIEDKLRNMFDKLYTNEPIPKVTKAFFDIEYDGINYEGVGIDEDATCPINAISLINEVDHRVYSLLLRNPSNPLISEFEKYAHTPQIHKDIKEFVKEKVGGWKNEKRYGLDKYNYKFRFYDDEIMLICDLFIILNFFKPNFVLAWNGSGFDFNYIMKRIQNLGYDPKDIICDTHAFKTKFIKHYVDRGKDKDGKFKVLAERGDFTNLSCCWTFIDQEIQFASRRKGQSKFIRYTLDFIGEVICGVRKLDYSHITNKIQELPYKDYKTFVFYNIMDTIVQYCIEKKTGDVDYIYNKSLMNNIRYSKVHRQTAYQTTRMAKDFYNYFEDGLILGNNFNCNNPKPKEKYPGALNASPIKLGDGPKKVINGRVLNIVENTVDYDYSAQYPNAARQSNMAPHTSIGKIIIDEVIYSYENPFRSKYYDRGGDFLECYMSRNILELCTRWFSLADYTELIDDIREYFTINNYMYMKAWEDHKVNWFRRLSEDKNSQFMTRLNPDEKVSFMIKDINPDYSVSEKIDVDELVYNHETRYVKISNADKNGMLEDEEEEEYCY